MIPLLEVRLRQKFKRIRLKFYLGFQGLADILPWYWLGFRSGKKSVFIYFVMH